MATHYRALFISDVHLGTPWAQAPRLLDLLDQVRADTLYLVGDIVDFWRIRRGIVWPAPHGEVLKAILRLANAGTRVVFIPGNHDDGLRAYCGTTFGRIEICRSAVHVTLTGRRYLVTHGDEHDTVVQRARWLALIGDRGYALALAFNRPFNWVRGLLGKDYWSISAWLKHRVKSCVGRACDFESSLVAAASAQAASGVICGHIHHAASRNVGDVHYVNTGDWVESCTAVVETPAGELEVIDWTRIAGDGSAGAAEHASGPTDTPAASTKGGAAVQCVS
jgi:UDP-2,3-diacylglucosamine pyrophosphatase LpxH